MGPEIVLITERARPHQNSFDQADGGRKPLGSMKEDVRAIQKSGGT